MRTVSEKLKLDASRQNENVGQQGATNYSGGSVVDKATEYT